MAKLLLRIDVVHDEDDDGKVVIKLLTHDRHIGSCPTCLGLYSLRIANAFLNAIEEVHQDGEDDTPAHPVH